MSSYRTESIEPLTHLQGVGPYLAYVDFNDSCNSFLTYFSLKDNNFYTYILCWIYAATFNIFFYVNCNYQ